MPIAFDPPTHAPHGALPSHGRRSVEEDDVAGLDVFTQLLLAAASVQDAGAPIETTLRPEPDDGKPVDAPVLAVAIGTPVASVDLTGVPDASAALTVVRGKVAPIDVRAGQGPLVTTANPTDAPDARNTLRVPTTPVEPSGPIALPRDPSAGSLAVAPVVNPQPDPSALGEALRDMPASRSSGAPANAAATLAALLAPGAADKLAGPRPIEHTPAAASVAVVQPAASPAPLRIETISAPAFTPGWQDETVSKLAQVVLSRTERAELRLHPAELGPVSVRIEMRADQASVQIVAASAETRSALEQSLPQLRDLLATQGITLGQATVNDGSAHPDARPGAWASAPRNASTGDPGAAAASPDTVHLILRRPDRLVDVFA